MTNEEIEEITAVMNTFRYLYPNACRICPKCNKYILIDGYVCLGVVMTKVANRITLNAYNKYEINL